MKRAIVALAWVLATTAISRSAEEGSSVDPVEASYAELCRSAAAFEEAGRAEEASRARQGAEALRPILIAKLERLESEVRNLRGLVGSKLQIVTGIEVWEISRTKAANAGLDLPRIDVACPHIDQVSPRSSPRFGTLDDTRELQSILAAMQVKECAKQFADAKLVTLDGRPCSFHSGGEFPTTRSSMPGVQSIEFKRCGMQADLIPILLGNDRVRMEFRVRWSEIDKTHTVKIGDVEVPGLRSCECESGAELRSGQTIVVRGLWQSRTETVNQIERKEEVELLVILRPEIAQPWEGGSSESVRPDIPAPAQSSPRPLPPGAPQPPEAQAMPPRADRPPR